MHRAQPRESADKFPLVSRRGFMGAALAGAMLSGTGAARAQSNSAIPYRPLGETGENVSVIGLGGSHIGIQGDEEESIRIIRTAMDNGIHFMDNSWDYNGGQSEIRMGKALRGGYRRRVFLMTKVDGRTRQAAADQLDESLRRLQTDYVDLLQFHEIIRMEDADRIFAPGGTLDAVLEARRAGKLRFIGFTGHKSPDIHLRMLEVAEKNDFRFDTAQMPLNVMDAHFESFERRVLPVLLSRGIAPLGMKPLGNRYILDSKTATPTECLHYAMNLPVSVVITGCDSLGILDQALNAARAFQPLSEQEVSALLAKTAAAARNGRYEHCKTGTEFDSTAKHPEWLG